jgi:hypothetical protein
MSSNNSCDGGTYEGDEILGSLRSNRRAKNCRLPQGFCAMTGFCQFNVTVMSVVLVVEPLMPVTVTV